MSGKTPKTMKEDRALLARLGGTLEEWKNDLVSLKDGIERQRSTLAESEKKAVQLEAAIAGAERIVASLKGEA